jgi:hypothetical protein
MLSGVYIVNNYCDYHHRELKRKFVFWVQMMK